MSFFGPTTVGPTTVLPPSNHPCSNVNATKARSVFLIPAAIIIIILSFLRKRRSFKKGFCGSRPGIVVPIDFLGIDDDRLTIMCVFGAAAGSIFLLIVDRAKGNNAWETAFLSVGACLEVAFLYYPYFGCLASYHRIIGALMGLPYGIFHFVVELGLEICNKYSSWQTSGLLPLLPGLFCKLFILGKFIGVLYNGIKESGICGGTVLANRNKQSPHKVKLVRPWLVNYVKDLVNSRSCQYSRVGFYLSKVYRPVENFKFSTQTVSVMMVCLILLYNISVSILIPYIQILKALNYNDICNSVQHLYQLVFANQILNPRIARIVADALVRLLRGILISIIVATVLTFIFCLMSIIRSLENHKNNMLRMFKGNKSFIPSYIKVSQFIIGKGLRYHCFQIGYFLWGYFLLLLLLFVVCFCFYSLKFQFIRDKVLDLFKGAGVLAGVAIFTRMSLPLASFTIFRDHEYAKDVISINNRNVYLLFSYFWFFVGLPMGFFSALSRFLKSMAVGALMMPRIDHSVMPDGFQRIDQGFNSYICYLHVQAAYRNPILRVFCQILNDTVLESQGQNQHILGNNKQRKWTFSAQARARWFLALTLVRNPQLASARRQHVPVPAEPVQFGYARQSDVEIEVGQYGSDNIKLINDK